LTLVLHDCVVQDLSAAVERTVHCCVIQAEILRDSFERGDAEIVVPSLVFASVRVVARNGHSVAGESVGVVFEDTTIETQTSLHGHVNLLLSEGEYLLYLREEPEVTERLIVNRGQTEPLSLTLYSH